MSGIFTKNNHLTEESIAQYVEAMQFDRTQDLPAAALEHVEGCGQCHGEIVELYRLVQVAPAIPESISPLKKYYKQLLRLAGLFIITLLALFFFNREKTGSAMPEIPIEKIDSSKVKNILSIPLADHDESTSKIKKSAQHNPKTPKKEKKNSQFAANFLPSEDLEPLAGADLRAYGMENMQPETGSRFKVEEIITFSWNFEKEKIYWLYIVNNREDQLLQQAVSDTAFVYQLALNPGFYYWKIEDEEELLFVGKFFVEKE